MFVAGIFTLATVTYYLRQIRLQETLPPRKKYVQVYLSARTMVPIPSKYKTTIVVKYVEASTLFIIAQVL